MWPPPPDAKAGSSPEPDWAKGYLPMSDFYWLKLYTCSFIAFMYRSPENFEMKCFYLYLNKIFICMVCCEYQHPQIISILFNISIRWNRKNLHQQHPWSVSWQCPIDDPNTHVTYPIDCLQRSGCDLDVTAGEVCSARSFSVALVTVVTQVACSRWKRLRGERAAPPRRRVTRATRCLDHLISIHLSGT